MTDITAALKSLHETYVTVSGLKLEFTFQRLHAWELWRARGWEKPELLLVLGFLKEAIRSGRRWNGALGFRALIEKTDVFEEHLAEARAWGRIPRMDAGKREVLRATGRLEPIRAKSRSAAEILRDDQAFKDFQAFARSL